MFKLRKTFKEHILTKISAYYEKQLRDAAKSNSRMKYFNVSLLSLRGRHHPSLNNIITSHEVRKSRIHLKMLCGDFLTYETKALQSGGSPHCRVCFKNTKVSNNENTQHILTSCPMYDAIRERIFPEYDLILNSGRMKLKLNDFASDNETLCQFRRHKYELEAKNIIQ